MINTVFTWLREKPGFQTLRREALEIAEGEAGLFCLGRKELSRERNILGVTRVRQSVTFKLCIHSADRTVPEFLLALDLTHAPVLGADQTVTCTQGHMSRDDGTLMCRYEATLTFTFTSEE